MALNKIYASTERLHREREVGADVQPGTPVLVEGRPAVTLTASGGSSVTDTTNLPDGLVSVTYENGGIGNLEDYATVAFDGTFQFEVTGALTTTESDVEVFITSAGALTLTEGSNEHFGWTDYPRDYTKVAGVAPVRIGA